MVGGEVLDGASGAAVTVPDCAELALLEPAEFDAVTVTRSVDPTSPDITVYDCPLAPAMSLHDPPLESQRRHWYA
jgi:hypothetical protein